MSVVLLGRV